jgi:hypothetical protein
VTTDVVVVQVELSSSATNASLTDFPTNSGNSSERKRKSTDTQFAFPGTVRSTFRIVTSRSELPRTAPPPSFAPLLPVEFGVAASVASPVVSMPKLPPVSGKDVSGVSETAVGLPVGGIVTKLAPVTFGPSGPSAIALAMSPAERVGVIAASAIAGSATSAPIAKWIAATAALLKVRRTPIPPLDRS